MSTLTVRPRRLGVVAVIISAVLVAGTWLAWVALPANLQATFTLFQVVTLLAILGFLVLVILSVGTSYVRADADGLRFRNGLRTHRVAWVRVHKILLRQGDPWALLLVRPADGTAFRADLDAEKYQLMGIQAGEAGQEAVRAVLAQRPSRP